MICAWEQLRSILPIWLRSEVDKLKDRGLQQIHLRTGKSAQFDTAAGTIVCSRQVTDDDLQICINAATKYSPWAAQTVQHGYITVPGGHRIGICGICVVQNNTVTTFIKVRSLCIRVAADFPGIAAKLSNLHGSLLILGPPGSGKTTLIRDLIRRISHYETVGVADERSEIFPNVNGKDIFDPGPNTDVISGCPKAHGMDILLRTMTPQCIAVDEVTAKEDCVALSDAAWSGVRLLATAHASDVHDLLSRSVYRPLVETKLFETAIVLQPDKSCRIERIQYDC